MKRPVPRSKRRWLRDYPAPEQPPAGYTTWPHPDRPGEVLYIPAEAVQWVMSANIEDYDRLPRELRDIIKERGSLG